MPTIQKNQISNFLDATRKNIDTAANPKLGQLMDNLSKAVSNDASVSDLYASLGNVALYMPDAEKTLLLGALANAGATSNVNAGDRATLFSSLSASLMGVAMPAPTPSAALSVSNLVSKGADSINNSYAELDKHYGAMSASERTKAIIADMSSDGVNSNDSALLRREGEGRAALGEYLENTEVTFDYMHHAIYMNAGNDLISQADKLDGRASTVANV